MKRQQQKIAAKLPAVALTAPVLYEMESVDLVEDQTASLFADNSIIKTNVKRGKEMDIKCGQPLKRWNVVWATSERETIGS